ncbi:MAG: hypothetical protein AB1746_05430, partial [Candidatus Zixiibacteriota bacterium]
MVISKVIASVLGCIIVLSAGLPLTSFGQDTTYIAYDTLISGALGELGEVDAFIFSGISADLVTLRLMPMTNNNFNARL